MRRIVYLTAAFAMLIGLLSWGGPSPRGVVPVGDEDGQYVVGGAVVTATATATVTGTATAPQCSKYKKVSDVDCKTWPKDCDGAINEIDCGTKPKIEADEKGSINAKNVSQNGGTCVVCGNKPGAPLAVCTGGKAIYSTWSTCKVKTATTTTTTTTTIGGVE